MQGCEANGKKAPAPAPQQMQLEAPALDPGV